MRSWVLAVLLATIGAIGCNKPGPSSSPGGSEKQKLANEIRRNVALKLKQETDLRPIGTVGQMMNQVQVLGLSFCYYKPLDIVEGRKLIIKAVNSLMEEVNQEKRIHPYLSRYPFGPWNIEITIFIRSPDGRDAPSGTLWDIEASEGIIRYQIDHPETKRLTDVYKETYEEALERLKDPSLPLVPFQPDPKISQEDVMKLRKGISMVSDDGAVWHLDENGGWVKDPKSQKSPP